MGIAKLDARLRRGIAAAVLVLGALLAVGGAHLADAKTTAASSGSSDKSISDQDLLRCALTVQFEMANGLYSEPVDASLVFDDASGRYAIDPGRPWGAYDVDRAVALVEKAVESGRFSVALDSCRESQRRAADDPALVAACEQANTCLESAFDLQVQGTTVASVLDERAVALWVDGVEAAVDNVGGARTYLRPDGKEVTVSGGTYGWVSHGAETEQLVLDRVSQGFAGAVEIPMKQQAAVYNPGGADWGARYVDVDLTEQRARFYEADGSLVVETPIISGSVLEPGYATPEGVYAITGKQLDVVLIGLPDPQTGEPSYETHVDYWMPFVGNMVGLHDADWQTWWSPEAYRSGAGSHGCVNMPPDTAAWAYDWVEVGTPVVVHS